MNDYEAILDTLDAIKKKNPANADDYLHTISVIVSLFHELNGAGNTAASYTRLFKHDRLHIRVDFEKGK